MGKDRSTRVKRFERVQPDLVKLWSEAKQGNREKLKSILYLKIVDELYTHADSAKSPYLLVECLMRGYGVWLRDQQGSAFISQELKVTPSRVVPARKIALHIMGMYGKDFHRATKQSADRILKTVSSDYQININRFVDFVLQQKSWLSENILMLKFDQIKLWLEAYSKQEEKVAIKEVKSMVEKKEDKIITEKNQTFGSPLVKDISKQPAKEVTSGGDKEERVLSSARKFEIFEMAIAVAEKGQFSKSDLFILAPDQGIPEGTLNRYFSDLVCDGYFRLIDEDKRLYEINSSITVRYKPWFQERRRKNKKEKRSPGLSKNKSQVDSPPGATLAGRLLELIRQSAGENLNLAAKLVGMLVEFYPETARAALFNLGVRLPEPETEIEPEPEFKPGFKHEHEVKAESITDADKRKRRKSKPRSKGKKARIISLSINQYAAIVFRLGLPEDLLLSKHKTALDKMDNRVMGMCFSSGINQVVKALTGEAVAPVELNDLIEKLGEKANKVLDDRPGNLAAKLKSLALKLPK